MTVSTGPVGNYDGTTLKLSSNFYLYESGPTFMKDQNVYYRTDEQMWKVGNVQTRTAFAKTSEGTSATPVGTSGWVYELGDNLAPFNLSIHCLPSPPPGPPPPVTHFQPPSSPSASSAASRLSVQPPPPSTPIQSSKPPPEGYLLDGEAKALIATACGIFLLLVTFFAFKLLRNYWNIKTRVLIPDDKYRVPETELTTMSTISSQEKHASGGRGWKQLMSNLHETAELTSPRRRTLKEADALGVSDVQDVYDLRGRFESQEVGRPLLERQGSRFATRTLVFGEMSDAAHGVMHFMNVDRKVVLKSEIERGLDGIRLEFDAFLAAARASGELERIDVAEQVHECMRYVLDQEAGSSSLIFNNSPYRRDCDETGLLPSRMTVEGKPMKLRDFANSPEAQTACLDETHVAALRIYSTAAFEAVNDPLRHEAMRRLAAKEDRSSDRSTAVSDRSTAVSDRSTAVSDRSEQEEQSSGVYCHSSEDRPPHPLPLTTWLIAEAAKKLRTVETSSESAHDHVNLYRGMANVEAKAEFLRKGGTEVAPMSTTSDLNVAVQYALRGSQIGILLRLKTTSAMQRGADIRFLSAYPGEKEYLLPPLTYLEPKGSEEVTIAGKTLTVIIVEPRQ